MLIAVRPLLVAAALAGGILSCGEAGSVRSGSRESAVVGGTPSTGDGAVVALVERRADCSAGAVTPFCTGVLVGSRAVLTAAHCASVFPAHDVEVFLGPDTAASGAFVGVVEARVHPAFDPVGLADDLAVLVLDADAPAAPVPFSFDPLDAAIVGEVVRVVGFGAASAGGAAGPKLTGTVRVASLDATTLRYEPSPAMTCGGDSGGPVLRSTGGGEVVVAITRSGDAACASYGEAMRLDAARDFLDPILAAIAASPPPAVAPDPSFDACTAPCSTDSDCPDGLLCLSARAEGNRCGSPSLRIGRFGATCSSAADCDGGSCAALGSGDARSCRCFAPCAAPTTTATTTPATPPSPDELSPSGGGCSASRSPVGLPAWPVVAALIALVRRPSRARRRTPSRRRSS